MAAPKRKTAPAIEVPQTDAAADALLKRYGENLNALARIGATMKDGVAELKAKFEADADPLKHEIAAIEKQLAAFAGAHRDRLTSGGTKKTVKLPAGEMGWRMQPKSVQFAKGLNATDIVLNIRARLAALEKNKKTAAAAYTILSFLRTKIEVDKEAMLKHEELAATIDGITIGSKGEEFFLLPVGLELAEPKP